MLIDRVAVLQSALDGLLGEDLVGVSGDELAAAMQAFESVQAAVGRG